jgi:hypothetical protein
VFRVGDVILGLTAPWIPRRTNLLGPALIDKIAAQRAGGRVVFAVHRGADYLRLELRLGSLIDPSGPGSASTVYPSFALV